MNKEVRISEAEWLVCRVLWQQQPLTANDIVKALSDKTLWKPKTVKTLVNRLVRKGVLGFEKAGRHYRYFPLLSEHDCVMAETEAFLERVFGGAFQPMLAAFLQKKSLSPEQIEEIKRILDKKGDS